MSQTPAPARAPEYLHRRVVTPQMVTAVEALRAKGLTDQQIVQRVGLSLGTVRRLTRGNHPLQLTPQR